MGISQRKRKTIHDFFLPAAKRASPGVVRSSMLAESTTGSRNIVALDKLAVPGLILFQDFITSGEEWEILSFLNDSSRCTWRTDLSRRTMHFGGEYCLMPPKGESSRSKTHMLRAPDMPIELSWLIQRMIDNDIFEDSKRPQYCIVNEYTSDLGISAHTENFGFAEPVVGLSLLSACPIRFHELTTPFDGSVRSGRAGKAEKTGKKVDVGLPGRSLLVMRGDSRWKWQHEIVRSRKERGGPGWKRISLTFRFKEESTTRGQRG